MKPHSYGFLFNALITRDFDPIDTNRFLGNGR